jgi:hypothetical protein
MLALERGHMCPMLAEVVYDYVKIHIKSSTREQALKVCCLTQLMTSFPW